MKSKGKYSNIKPLHGSEEIIPDPQIVPVTDMPAVCQAAAAEVPGNLTLWNQLAERIRSTRDVMSVGDIARCLNAFERANFRSTDLFFLLQREILEDLSKLSPGETVDVLTAYMNSGCHNRKFFNSLVASLTGKAADLSLEHVCRLAAAANSLGLNDARVAVLVAENLKLVNADESREATADLFSAAGEELAILVERLMKTSAQRSTTAKARVAAEGAADHDAIWAALEANNATSEIDLRAIFPSYVKAPAAHHIQGASRLPVGAVEEMHRAYPLDFALTELNEQELLRTALETFLAVAPTPARIPSIDLLAPYAEGYAKILVAAKALGLGPLEEVASVRAAMLNTAAFSLEGATLKAQAKINAASLVPPALSSAAVTAPDSVTRAPKGILEAAKQAGVEAFEKRSLQVDEEGTVSFSAPSAKRVTAVGENPALTETYRAALEKLRQQAQEALSAPPQTLSVEASEPQRDSIIADIHAQRRAEAHHREVLRSRPHRIHETAFSEEATEAPVVSKKSPSPAAAADGEGDDWETAAPAEKIQPETLTDDVVLETQHRGRRSRRAEQAAAQKAQEEEEEARLNAERHSEVGETVQAASRRIRRALRQTAKVGSLRGAEVEHEPAATEDELRAYAYVDPHRTPVVDTSNLVERLMRQASDSTRTQIEGAESYEARETRLNLASHVSKLSIAAVQILSLEPKATLTAPVVRLTEQLVNTATALEARDMTPAGVIALAQLIVAKAEWAARAHGFEGDNAWKTMQPYMLSTSERRVLALLGAESRRQFLKPEEKFVVSQLLKYARVNSRIASDM